MRLGSFIDRRPANGSPSSRPVGQRKRERWRPVDSDGVAKGASSFLTMLAIHGRFERLGQVSLVVLAVLAILVAMWAAKGFLLPTTLGIVIAFMGTPIASRLERLGLPSYLAAGLMVLALISVALALFLIFAPSLQEWVGRIPHIADKLRGDLSSLRSVVTAVESATREVQSTVHGPKPAGQQAVVVDDGGWLPKLAGLAPAFLARSIYTLMLTFFLLAERKSIRAIAIRLPRSFTMRLRMARVVVAMRDNVGRYLLTVASINVVLGSLAGLMFYGLGVPNSGLWGAGVGLLNFIPFVGPITMQLVVFMVCYVSYEGLAQAVVPPLLLGALNFIEGNLVTPTIVGQRMRLRPLAVFVAIAFGAWIWGIGGAFVATPLTILLWTLFRGLYRPVAPLIQKGHDAPVRDQSVVAPLVE